MRPHYGFGLCFVLFFIQQFAIAGIFPLRILHTNDLHSHYREDKGDFKLGGLGRLSTAIRQAQAEVSNSILLDGGDWSEGSIYYNLDAGRTALEVMNFLGYNASVLGNHDWLNGPDQIIKIINQAQPQFSILAANINVSQYERGQEFLDKVLPYKIIRAGNLKIGVIGLVTKELIYEKWFNPVVVEEPIVICRKLSAELKKQVDLVVVISHNSFFWNNMIAGLPNVDLVIHAHDHEKFAQPVKVVRNKKTSYIIEAYKWGFFLGQMDLTVNTDTKTFDLIDYKLNQIDERYIEDPKATSLVNNFEKQLENSYGDIFHDHIADIQIDLRNDFRESLLGDVIADAFREHLNADVAFDQIKLTSNELHPGALDTVDVFNALSAVFNITTNKAWTLKTAQMTGQTLYEMLNLILSVQSYTSFGLIHVSGLYAVYDPLNAEPLQSQQTKRMALKYLEIGGKPYSPNKVYTVAMPQGVLEIIDFMEHHLGASITLQNLKDTGVEEWRILAEYLKKHSPIGSSQITRGNRIMVLQSDLALYHDQVTAARKDNTVDVEIKIWNYGSAVSAPRELTVMYDKTPKFFGDDPNTQDTNLKIIIPPIMPQQFNSTKLSIELPAEFKNISMPLYFQINKSKDDPNVSNDGTWVMAE